MRLWWLQDTQQIQSELHGWCVEASPKARTVHMANCDASNPDQKWEWKFTNTKLIHDTFPPFSGRDTL